MTILILQRTRQRNIMCEALPNGIVGLRTQRVKLIRINVEITLAVNSERPQQHLPQNTIFKVGRCWQLDIGWYTLYTFIPRDIPGKRITNYWDDKNTPTQTSCSTLFASFFALASAKRFWLPYLLCSLYPPSPQRNFIGYVLQPNHINLQIFNTVKCPLIYIGFRKFKAVGCVIIALEAQVGSKIALSCYYYSMRICHNAAMHVLAYWMKWHGERLIGCFLTRGHTIFRLYTVYMVYICCWWAAILYSPSITWSLCTHKRRWVTVGSMLEQ